MTEAGIESKHRKQASKAGNDVPIVSSNPAQFQDPFQYLL